MENKNIHYVRTEMLPSQEPPAGERGFRKWIWDNLLESMSDFSSPGAAVSSVLMMLLTVIMLIIAWWSLTTVFYFAFPHAIWSGEDGSYCRHVNNRGKVEMGVPIGACWAWVDAKFGQLMNGFFPEAERWRVYLTYVIGVAVMLPLAMPSVPYKAVNALVLVFVYPIIAAILLTGGNFNIEAGTWSFWLYVFFGALVLVGIYYAVSKDMEFLKSAIMGIVAGAIVVFGLLIVFGIDFGMPFVESTQWGGLLLTLVIGITGIIVSLPIGIMLALGRRSRMPAVRLASVIFIEAWRGVPLITVLFMSSVMLPLFLPEGVTLDKVIRPLIGVALFSSAYMAEVVRGGLQAIPKGQYEGAQALGLSFWKMTWLIIMPQALKLVIPGIVNTFIGLFKDTTLVSIIGMFDFLGMGQTATTDPKWLHPTQQMTLFLFLSVIYWIFCYGMSRYSIYTENRLHTGHKR